MSGFQARVGLACLGSAAQGIAHRRRIADFYERYLLTRGWEVVQHPSETVTNFLRYPVRVANKWQLLECAEEARIELGSWFESALHPVRTSLGRFGYRQGQCRVAEQTAGEVINLPIHPRLTPEEAKRTVEFLCQVGRKLEPAN